MNCQLVPGLFLLCLALPAVAQQPSQFDSANEEEIVSYDESFFERYQPNSALDMLGQIPGFQVDDGDDKRGFGAAAGNILINDRYPSAKQEKPSNILERIPANQVRRIDLLRGQVRGIDLRGQSVVASVILHDDLPGSARWQLALRKNFEHRPVTVRGSMSWSDSWRDVDYNAGIVLRHFRSGELGNERVFDANGVLDQYRNEDSFLRGDEGNVSLNASTWLGETLLSTNSQLAFEKRRETLEAIAAPGAPVGQSDDFFVDEREKLQIELGVDAERSLSPDLLSKGILLYTRAEDDARSFQNSFDSVGSQLLFRDADSNVVESEAIARLEFDWAGWENHASKLDLETARNVIDSELLQVVDDGAGPVVVPVPGGNTRVEESRFELLLNDTWYLNAFEVDYGIGAEWSTIRQSGDATSKRSFSYIKPRASLAYSPHSGRQTRLRIAREVSQLDFSDFISSTVFQDDDLALGNPDLEPESTWLVELSEERRLGELSVFKLTLFHHWISDVEDLLPLTARFEAPGNIGDGRRWGAEFEMTVPLDATGFRNARLDITSRLQHSDVTDPVTAESRELSGEENVGKPLFMDDENRYAVSIDLRQDFEEAAVAWGASLRKRGDRVAYRVDELVEYEDGYEVNLFIETTRWLGLKLSAEALNLMNFDQVRYRRIYVGQRGLSPVDLVEVREHIDGRRLIVSASGTF